MCEFAEPIGTDDSCEVARSTRDDLDTIDRLICESVERLTAYLSSFEINPSLQGITEYLWDLGDLLFCKRVECSDRRCLELCSDLFTIFLDLLSECKY